MPAWLLGCLLLVVAPAWASIPLQPLIDATPAGGHLALAPGEYAGPVTIDKPIHLDGGGKAVLRGDANSTVLTLRASASSLRGLVISGSGDLHDRIDAGLLIEGDDNLIEDNRMDDVLFGIHVKQGNRNRIIANRILGKPHNSGLRGDGLRLWYSRHNLIEGNHFERVRDLIFDNSPENRFIGNTLHDGRCSMEIVFSPKMIIERNAFTHTATGIIALYSSGLVIRGNRIVHARGGGGAGIAFKESSETLVEGNEIIDCAVGLSSGPPPGGGAALIIRNNRFAYNIIGMYFYGEISRHQIVGNRFEQNLTQVSASAPSAANTNHWQDNYWSDYQGFDRDGDGIGDTPHEIVAYADRIWMETPKATFFRNSPALELLDFLERLAPFAEPALLLRDPAPRMK
ncbi:MAG: nitrous oxide reductase family maturation protein NosD [Burkholderiaceae bacterium]|jgi:nitrous oxidase accessory protein|nr:nitrous oxide reductase family maturation protein NosD [Burkholderiaceae bacterium]